MKAICVECHQDKDIIEFGKYKYSKSGFRKTCKKCRSKLEKGYRDKDIVNFRLKRKKYRQENIESVNALARLAGKRYRIKHKEKLKEKDLLRKPKTTMYKKDYYQKNKDKLMRDFYIKKYGITLEQKLEMLKKQEYSCDICKIELLNSSVAYVDHDHETGVIRGILCNTCNRALGMFKDNVEVLESAVKYLRKQQ